MTTVSDSPGTFGGQIVYGVESIGSNLATVSPVAVTTSVGVGEVGVSGATADAVLTLYTSSGSVAA